MDAKITLPKTNSSPLKIGRDPNRKGLYSNHPFSGAMAVSFREGTLLGIKWVLLKLRSKAPGGSSQGAANLHQIEAIAAKVFH